MKRYHEKIITPTNYINERSNQRRQYSSVIKCGDAHSPRIPITLKLNRSRCQHKVDEMFIPTLHQQCWWHSNNNVNTSEATVYQQQRPGTFASNLCLLISGWKREIFHRKSISIDFSNKALRKLPPRCCGIDVPNNRNNNKISQRTWNGSHTRLMHLEVHDAFTWVINHQ